MFNAFVAQAADITIQPETGGPFENLGNLEIGAIISGLITLALIVAAVVFFFMLVIGGIRWILSGGDKGQTEAARSQITAALIGLVIVFAAWAIAGLLGTFFDVKIFSDDFKLPSLDSSQSGSGGENTPTN